MSLTTDNKDPRLGKSKDDNSESQNEAYLVLSDEEIAKGLVRPVRTKYIHVGRYYEHKPNILNEIYKANNKVYVATIPSLVEGGRVIGSTYVTQEELDEYNKHEKKGGYIGGCGTMTEMNITIAETYARKPSFYSSTYCVGCKAHLPVSEFIWDGTNQKVGS